MKSCYTNQVNLVSHSWFFSNYRYKYVFLFPFWLKPTKIESPFHYQIDFLFSTNKNMESVGAISGEWSSFSGMYSKEEADFVGQIFDNCSLPNEISWSSFFNVPTLLPGHEFFDNDSMYPLDNMNNNQFLLTNNCSTSMDYYFGGGTSSPVRVLTNSLVGVGDLQPEAVITEPEMLVPKPDQFVEEKPNSPLERLKKRSRNSGHVSIILSIFTLFYNFSYWQCVGITLFLIPVSWRRSQITSWGRTRGLYLLWATMKMTMLDFINRAWAISAQRMNPTALRSWSWMQWIQVRNPKGVQPST